MSYSLNEKIKDLKPYDPIQGEYQIRLDANESFFVRSKRNFGAIPYLCESNCFLTVILTHMPMQPLQHLDVITV